MVVKVRTIGRHMPGRKLQHQASRTSAALNSAHGARETSERMVIAVMIATVNNKTDVEALMDINAGRGDLVIAMLTHKGRFLARTAARPTTDPRTKDRAPHAGPLSGCRHESQRCRGGTQSKCTGFGQAGAGLWQAIRGNGGVRCGVNQGGGNGAVSGLKNRPLSPK